MRLQLDEGLFEIFSNSFFGYGKYRSRLWFVGPHADLLGTDENQAARRLEYWHRRGQREMVDLPGLHTSVGDPEWFGENARLHRVWSKLSRVAIGFEGRPPDESVRDYQSTELGRLAGKNAMLHLLAVDSRPDATWPYAGLDTPYLRSRELYVEWFSQRRAGHLTRLVARHKPEVIFFYDVTHRAYWQNVCDGSFEGTEMRNCFVFRGEHTVFFMIRHPESIGARNDYFFRAGALAADALNELHS